MTAIDREVDGLVLDAMRSIGSGSVLVAIWDRVLDRRPSTTRREVSAALKRLARAGVVVNHTNEGTLGHWGSGLRCSYWSTADAVRRQYGYSEDELRLPVARRPRKP